ncbi:MAG: TIR domain-containing protein [Verrucomicrobia bacterium]|nr:TIR domain-containing protein [Verrucomicrobiota bacterium]
MKTSPVLPIPFESHTGEGNYVFVSYSHADKAFVYETMLWFRQNGINIWYDEGIPPASEWLESIAFAIKKSVLFVIFISPRSVESRFVKSEVSYALGENKDILSIYIEDTTLPAGLSLCLQQFQSVFVTEENWRKKANDILAAKLTLDEETTVIVEAGALLSGFRLLRCIGKGGYGEVWLARSEKRSGLVAIKLIRVDDEEASIREMNALRCYREVFFKNEVSGIIVISRIGRTKNHLWYIMPLADGVENDSPEAPKWKPLTLTRFLNQRKQSDDTHWFGSGEIINIIIPLVQAVEVLAAKGLSHRDIKPDNVLFFNGVPHLGDIGLLAVDHENVTIRGTPGFAPPSWFLETRGNPDQWGLACLLFTMLTGNSPDVMGRVHYEWPPSGKNSLSDLEQEKWEALRRIVYRATEENPTERYRDFRIFREKIEAVRDGFCEDEVPQSRSVRSRRPMMLGLSCAVVTLLSFFCWIFLGEQEQEEQTQMPSLPSPPVTSPSLPAPPFVVPTEVEAKVLATGDPDLELRLNGIVVDLASRESLSNSKIFTLKLDDILTVRNDFGTSNLHFECLVVNDEEMALFGSDDDWRAFIPKNLDNWWDIPEGLLSEGLVRKSGFNLEFESLQERFSYNTFAIRSTMRQFPTVSFLYRIVGADDMMARK